MSEDRFKLRQPTWKMRRRAVFGTLVFSASIILLVVIRWDDTQLAQTLVLSMAGLMGSIIAAYTGFATWEDRGAIQKGHYDVPVAPTTVSQSGFSPDEEPI